jgi:hypothetical protein
VGRGDIPVITAQVVIETWAVATRPKSSNGLEWDAKRISGSVDVASDEFPILDEGSEVLIHWLDLVRQHDVKGKQVHDARLAAVLMSNALRHILTFNLSDFSRFTGITAIHPKDIVAQAP